jgi:hypothetical protein
LELHVEFVGDRRHLPVVTLRRMAWATLSTAAGLNLASAVRALVAAPERVYA